MFMVYFTITSSIKGGTNQSFEPLTPHEEVSGSAQPLPEQIASDREDRPSEKLEEEGQLVCPGQATNPREIRVSDN